MKRAIIPLACPPMDGDDAMEVDFDINEPGDIIDCLISPRPKVGGIVSAHSANKPQFEIIPTMLACVDPDAPVQKRHFIISPPMRVIQSEVGKTLTYRGRFLFPDGKMLVVFEET